MKTITITLDNDVLTVDRDGEKITDEKAVTAFLGKLWETAQAIYSAKLQVLKHEGEAQASLSSLDAQLTKAAVPKP